MEAEPDLLMLDCRQPFEWEICHLPGSRLIPLGELMNQVDVLDRHRPVVVVCHLGPRSAIAASFLAQAGFTDVAYLEGGLHAWSMTVDPRMPRY